MSPRLAIPVSLLLLALPAPPAGAVPPLVVDDAATADAGQLEFEAFGQLVRAGEVRNTSSQLAFAYGIAPNVQIGIDFGYQWERRRLEGGEVERVDGLLDTVVSAKWIFLEADGYRPALGIMPRLKLPTAPEGRGLGTGEVDAGLLALATWELGAAELDVNVGYTVFEAFRRPFREGELFAGAALRYQATERLWVAAELFATAPEARLGETLGGTTAAVALEMNERLTLALGIGTGLGPGAEDLSLTAGLVWVFP